MAKYQIWIDLETPDGTKDDGKAGILEITNWICEGLERAFSPDFVKRITVEEDRTEEG